MYYPGICLFELKTTANNINIAVDSAEIWTEYLQNTRLECNSYPLGAGQFVQSETNRMWVVSKSIFILSASVSRKNEDNWSRVFLRDQSSCLHLLTGAHERSLIKRIIFSLVCSLSPHEGDISGSTTERRRAELHWHSELIILRCCQQVMTRFVYTSRWYQDLNRLWIYCFYSVKYIFYFYI
jgi:hypothetical protein